MSNPRVLHLIHHLRIGGAERLLVDLLPLLAEEGFDVHAACLDDRGPFYNLLQKQGIPCHFIGRRRGPDLVALWRLQQLMRRLRVDLVNTHAFSAGLWGRLAARGARIPKVVTTFHSVAGWSQPWKQPLCNRLLRPLTDHFVAVSESVRRSLVAREQTRPELIRVIYNGICRDRFYRSSDVMADRRKLGLPPDGTLIGMLARCRPEKGGAVWVRALGDLKRARIDVQGVLVGEGPELAVWKALAAREGVANRIHFAGLQVDAAAWLAVMDILVCPSLQESFGLAALEAQAAGIPVIASRIDGFVEVLHDGEDALLVRPGSPASLTEAIQRLLKTKALTGKLVAGGHRNMRRFTIRETAQQYARLYHELLDSEKGDR